MRNTCKNNARSVEQNWHHSEMTGDTNGTDYLVQKMTWIMVLQLLLLDMQGQGVERILMHKSKFSYCRWTCFGTELTWLIWGRPWEDCCTHNAAAEIIACIWQTLYVLPNRRSTSLCRFLSVNSGLAYWRGKKVMLILDKRKCQLIKVFTSLSTVVTVFSLKHRHTTLEINSTRMDHLHSKKCRT
jgi:hypothetical protein